MASIATIVAATDRVTLGSDRRAEHRFTVTNTTGKDLEVGLDVETRDPAQKAWAKIDGPSTRRLAAGGADQVTVTVVAPADAKPGTLELALLVFDSREPGDAFSKSPFASVEVPEAPKVVEKKPCRWCIPAAIAAAVVLMIGAGAGWYLTRPTLVLIPAGLVGMPTADVAKLLGEAFKVSLGAPVETRDLSQVGKVQRIEPDPTRPVALGSTVTLIDAVAAKVQVPGNLFGMEASAAVKVLSDLGLLPQQAPETNNTVPNGSVLGTDPPESTQVPIGSAVTVRVANIEIVKYPPNIVGMHVDQAKSALEQLGFTVRVTSNFVKELPEAKDHLVILAAPPSSAPHGSDVTLAYLTNDQVICIPCLKLKDLSPVLQGMVTKESAKFAPAVQPQMLMRPDGGTAFKFKTLLRPNP